MTVNQENFFWNKPLVHIDNVPYNLISTNKMTINPDDWLLMLD